MNRKPLILFLLVLLLRAGAAAHADEVDDFIKAEMKKRSIPGLSLAVAREGKIIKVAGYGLANVELNVPATPDTVYQMASISKQVIAAGIMLLVQDGKVDIDEKLSKYLDATPESWKEITLRQLLTHTSGMARDDRLGMQSAPTDVEYFKALAGMKLASAPGTKWAYSNAGFNLLGMVIEKVSGKPWEEFLKERIFVPLGMSATRRLSLTAVIPNRAAGYVREKGGWQNAPALARNLAAGGFLTTVTDLAKWDAALYTDNPLTQSSREQMWTPARLKDGSPVKLRDGSYGFGWSIAEQRGHKVVAHGGSRPGFNSYISRYVNDKLTVIVLTNLGGAEPATLASGVAGYYIHELKELKASGVEVVPARKIVLIAGEKSHAPNTHEYEKGVRLFKFCLDNSPNVRGVETVVITNGWPEDARVLDDAASIVLFSDGSDIDEKKHPLLVGDRMPVFARQMNRGCGYVAIHYTTFTPKKLEERFLEWVGGYYDYESGPPPKHWWSKHVVDDYSLKPATPEHPIAQGMQPFKMREEFYFQMRFRELDKRRQNILSFGNDDASAVAWAVERADGGRGFAYTGGHFHKNWAEENVRRMVLNALLWTARVEVPAGGVQSKLPADWDKQFVPAPKKDGK